MMLLNVLSFPDGESVVFFDRIRDEKKAVDLGSLVAASRLEICFVLQKIRLRPARCIEKRKS